MTRKQLLILLCSTAVLTLVVLLMISGLLVAVTPESGLEAEPVESASGVSSLSGGNDCYCIPDESSPDPDATE